MQNGNTTYLDDILDICIDQIIAGNSVDACLAPYPAEAQALRPLLELVMLFRGLPRVTPAPESQERAREKLMAALGGRQGPNDGKRTRAA